MGAPKRRELVVKYRSTVSIVCHPSVKKNGTPARTDEACEHLAKQGSPFFDRSMFDALHLRDFSLLLSVSRVANSIRAWCRPLTEHDCCCRVRSPSRSSDGCRGVDG